MKKEEPNPLDPQRVFSVNHSDLRGHTQCEFNNHQWRKLNDMELYCPVCQTAIIVNAETLDELLCK